MSQEARNNAARTHEEDLLACSSYVETVPGATGQQNADVLGRLIVGAHARLDELERVLDAIKQSLENVVAPKLHELRQLPEQVEELRATLPLYAALRDRVEVIERDLQTANLERLPEGVTRTLEQRIARLEQGVDGMGG